ncbi:MAG: HEAT repeat domain-containing protein, partial [Acidobacteriota bacterium]
MSMYPPTHPAIQDALGRITTAGRLAVEGGSFQITVTPDTLLVGGRMLARPDVAVNELAGMLHAHSVGELNITGALEPAAWHSFLVLLSQSAAEIRDEGGITRAWEAAGGGPLEVRQIDYAEVLRERPEGDDFDWENILTAYLQGEQTDIDDKMLDTLLQIANNSSRMAAFIDNIVERATGENGWLSKHQAQLARLLHALAGYVSKTDPSLLDKVLRNLAGSVPNMSPEVLTSVLDEPQPTNADGQPEGIDLAGELIARIDQDIIARFVAAAVARDRHATARLAQAFHSLVPDEGQRGRVLDLAAEVASQGPLGREPRFDELWHQASDMLTSYTDEMYISQDYAGDLSRARTIAVEMDRIGDDPPERVAAWVATVSDEQVRRLDQQVLGDLLLVETRREEWRKVHTLALDRIEQLVLVGDLSPAQELLDTLLRVSRNAASEFASVAQSGVAQLAAGAVMTHILLFIRQADESEQPRATRFCLSLGKSVVGKLIDAILVEDGARTIRRLREVLMSFGSAARSRVGELCASPNPAVRRSAVELVRAVGGPETVTLLVTLLDDEELQVLRDDLRAIVQMGSDEGFARLRDALTSGPPRTREMITQSLSTLRDERAVPLFAFIIRQAQYRGALEKVYLTCLELLGGLRVSSEVALEAL